MLDSIVNGNSQNVATAKKINTRSQFDLSYHFFNTFRFAEYTPHFVMESVRGDKNIRLNSAHDVRSYSLKAPLMSKIQLKKDYFCVPMEAILPLNWDKVYTQPTIGDDVPSDAGTYVENFISLTVSYINTYLAPDFTDTSSTLDAEFTKLINFLLVTESIYSNGSLPASLGIHLSPAVWFTLGSSSHQVDEFIDFCCGKILDDLYDPAGIPVYIEVLNSSSQIVNSFHISKLRDFLVWYRDNLGLSIHLDSQDPDIALGSWANSAFLLNMSDEGDFGIDLARLFAYQIVCAHYYSNDFVDYVYSAELYRQYIHSFVANYYTSIGSLRFTYNGTKYLYDSLSAKFFNFVITSNNSLLIPQIPAYLQAIFGFKRSLRFVDYFVGAKTRPLAVGDTNVAVGVNGVNVVDFARGKMATQFYNAVNRFGRKFSNYLEGLIPDAAKVSPDYHNPFFIGHTADDIYGQEIENTNVVDQESQKVGLSVISNLRSNSSRFAFEFDSDRPCIIIGISYFDIPRAYTTTIERQVFHKDRFDMFNPFMQFIGDQSVYQRELSPSKPLQPPFGYQLRHAEYKQRYNQASGGFIKNLPGYAFMFDYDNGGRVSSPEYHIGPSFIRATPTELDRFYVLLTGFSLASYFHFIVDTYNNVSASRPMAYAPSIL